MNNVMPISALGREEIVELARVAADNGEPQHVANPFEPGTSQHHTFSHAYWARHRELTEVEV